MKVLSLFLLCALIATACGGTISGWSGSNSGWNYGGSNYGGGFHSGGSGGKIIKVITVSGGGWPSGGYSSGWPSSGYSRGGGFSKGWKLGGGWKPSGWSSGWKPSGWSSGAASRYEGATARLKFQDNKNKPKYLDAKIIRMSNDDKELNELEVDEESGEIIDRSQKAFTKKILASRILLQEEKKDCEKRKRSVEKKREEDALNTKPFLAEEKGPKSKKIKLSKITKGTTSFQTLHEEQKEVNTVTMTVIPSTSSTSDQVKTRRSQIPESNLTSETKDNEGEEKEEEIMDSISPKNVCWIPGVTTEILAFHKNLVASMEYSLDPGRQDVISKVTKLTKEILTNSEDKVEIFPNTGCYLRKSVMTSIDLLNFKDNDWKKYLTNILVQMFGDKLKFMSVKGYRGNVALHPKIWRALFSLINDKSESQISSKVFNQVLNKACTNRKATSTKISVIIDEKKENEEDDEEDDDNGNLNQDLSTLSNHQFLPPRSPSSSPCFDNDSRTSSLVIVDDQDKFEQVLENNIQKSPSTEQQSTLKSTINPAHSKSNFENQSMVPSTAPSTQSNLYPSAQSTVTSTITSTHSNSHYRNQSMIPSTVSSSVSNPYPHVQSTVPSMITPTYYNPHFYNQSMISPTVSSTYSNQYPQNQTTMTSVNSHAYPQHKSTSNSAQSTAHIQNQSTITPTNLNSYSQHQTIVTSPNSLPHSNSYFPNQPMNPSTASPIYSNSYLYNQPQNAFTGYHGEPQWYSHQQNYFSNNQGQHYQHQQNFN